jgi:hypothetical protein
VVDGSGVVRGKFLGEEGLKEWNALQLMRFLVTERSANIHGGVQRTFGLPARRPVSVAVDAQGLIPSTMLAR